MLVKFPISRKILTFHSICFYLFYSKLYCIFHIKEIVTCIAENIENTDKLPTKENNNHVFFHPTTHFRLVLDSLTSLALDVDLLLVSSVSMLHYASILLLFSNNVLFVISSISLLLPSHLFDLVFKRQHKLLSRQKDRFFHFSEPVSHNKQRNFVSKPIPVNSP